MHSESLKWYALSVYARQEKAAAKDLVGRGLEVFVPQMPQRRLWSDRIKTVQTPLFPGYLFLRASLDATNKVKILRPRQVIGIVGRRNTAMGMVIDSIPDNQIASLKLLIGNNRELDPINRLVKGVTIRVVSGPLQGAMGIVEQAPSGQRKLIVQMSILGRGVKTVLSADDVIECTDERVVCG